MKLIQKFMKNINIYHFEYLVVLLKSDIVEDQSDNQYIHTSGNSHLEAGLYIINKDILSLAQSAK